MNFETEYKNYLSQIDTALMEFLNQSGQYPESLRMAVEYSLFPGGKRLRPVLFLASFNGLFGKNAEEGIAFACAIELIHTFSLIHDDLPAMDNDDYRRGKLTNHKVFGDATAILAGDALLNLAYEIVIENALLYPENLTAHLKAMKVLANAAGAKGMVGGQIADIEVRWKASAEETLNYISGCKTAAIIEASLTGGAVLANASDTEIKALSLFGNSLGLAFQIIDDVHDYNDEPVALCGENCAKLTYPAVFGIDVSKKMARDLLDKAFAELELFGDKASFLRQFALYLTGFSL